MKAIPITQRCKSPMKLDETTLAAAGMGNPKFEDSAAGKVSKGGTMLGEAMMGKSLSKKEKEKNDEQSNPNHKRAKA